MIFLVRSKWPSHKGPEVMDAWNKRPPPQPSAVTYGPYNRGDLEHGFEAYSITEVEEGKESEGLQAIGQTLALFNAIEGYEWQVDIVVKGPEPTG